MDLFLGGRSDGLTKGFIRTRRRGSDIVSIASNPPPFIREGELVI